jgi:urea transporter/murein DD-endopeptidase MepM/ murein hydrolase activator NlpD
MYSKLKSLFPFFTSSVLNSYTQIFFSNNRVFAALLMLVTFFDLYAGLCGLLAILISNFIAYLIGFNRESCKAGYYGFNSLLVGLGLGVFFQPTFEMLIVLIFASILTLFLTVMTEGVIGKYGLPFLSIAFLLGIWLVIIASRQFSALRVSERDIYVMNEMYAMGGVTMVKIYNWFNALPWPESIKIYFRSLGAILFQYHLLPGLIVAIGLLIYSRIGFLLSVLGFYTAYAFYYFIGANFADLSYGYIGFNFILTAIAIGGFYVIPSRHSFLWVILLTPVIAVFMTSFNAIFSYLQLSIYSLPFNCVVLLFLYVMKFRERYLRKPEMVLYQYYSPEKNLYSHVNSRERFGANYYFPVSLPFIGTWRVSQGHDGKDTHKTDWRHAWDFEVADEEGRNHSGDGIAAEQYYCFGKPVVAPADGWVEEVIDQVEDNAIGEMNLGQNWGNTVVLRHSEQLFTKMSHLKRESIRVKPGSFVRKGDVVAACGNSGRSPFPHLHFQVQATPYIGSKTLDFPVSHYICHEKRQMRLCSFDRPKEGEEVSNIQPSASLEKAFHLIPGQRFSFRVSNGNGETSLVHWEVRIDAINNTWLHCETTGSRAWFRYDGEILYFTYFSGDRKSLLFHFYLGAYKVMAGFYKGLTLDDSYPLSILYPKGLIFLQDFLAPFRIFIRARYSLAYRHLEENLGDDSITLVSETRVKTGGRTLRNITAEFTVSPAGIDKINITDGNRLIHANRINENG